MRAALHVHEGGDRGEEGEGGDLGEVAAALRRPEAYPRRPASVEVHETHVSLVFLAGDRAYKVKKPVRFPFLDYSTPELRKHWCEEEVRLNRRLAPDVYQGVVPVTADGRIGGAGAVVDWAVEMERLPHDRMLDVLVDAGTARREDVERIADRLADFHAGAERAPGFGSPAQVERILGENLEAARRFLPETWRTRLTAEYHRLLGEHGPVLARRAAAGFVKDGHGDLHAANVCLTDGEVVIYDCIEFEPAFRCGDVAGEVAFLAMDLERRGAWDLARAFVDRYVARTGDEGLRPLLPLFARHRACVRGLVESLRTPPGPARAYFRLAVSYGLGPFLLLTCGLPGTGKSHLARAAARAFGADLYRSDVVRRELTGRPTERWEGAYRAGPYDPAVTERTYAVLQERADAALGAGRRVVADATFARRSGRDRMRALARERGVPGLVVHVTCAEEVVRRRLAQRARDRTEPSDANFGVYRRAQETFEAPLRPDVVHDGAGPPDAALDAIVDRLLVTRTARGR